MPVLQAVIHAHQGNHVFSLLQVAGYAGLLLATPTVLYELVAYVIPALTKKERQILAPIVFGSSILFYIGYAQPQTHCYMLMLALMPAASLPAVRSVHNPHSCSKVLGSRMLQAPLLL